MLHRVYCIFDNKALIYHPPFYAPNDGVARRIISDAMGDPNTALSRHPGDHSIFYIGDYDDAKGAMLPVSPLIHVADLVALLQDASPSSVFGQLGERAHNPINGGK